MILIMIFGKKNQKRMRAIWIVISILVVVSMILLYTPIFQ